MDNSGLYETEPALLFFYEIMPGDIDKYKTQSNRSKTGGGARDLRPRPANTFAQALAPMFPRETDRNGAYDGTIHWFDEHGVHQNADITLWTIYDARPGELRIGTCYKILAWTISEDEYIEAKESGYRWFYVLLMDRNHTTWAYIMREEELDLWTPQVSDYVRRRIASTPQGTRPQHVVGFLNFITGEEYG